MLVDSSDSGEATLLSAVRLYVVQQVDFFINRLVEAASAQPVPPEQR